MKNKILTAVFALTVALLILTVSIGLPIYFRPFYYAHIDGLHLPERTGYSYDTIKAAYDEMLDFCIYPWAEFGTGELPYSESGASHFADCKGLFILNGVVLILSAIALVVLIVLLKKGVFELVRPFGFDATFFSGAGLLTVFSVIALLASIDFSRAFVIFHTLFFPGKDNWLFNPYTDKIILVLPQEFFMNCAILIVSSIILLSLTFIILGIIGKVKRARASLNVDSEA